MSDFDREAERERLREQFEREEEKREVTERMSELLLQGATMTNAHCSACGDPIFRYEGQEFCATCEKPVDRGEEAGGDGEDGSADGDDGVDGTGSADQGADEDRIEVTAPSDDARVQFGAGEPPEGEEGADASGDEPVDHRNRTVGDAVASGTVAESGPAGDADAGSRPTERQERAAPTDRDETRESPAGGGSSRSRGAPRPGGSPGVDRARGALLRTLTRLSQQAEATEDPREAEAYLSAAREAAETLAALRH